MPLKKSHINVNPGIVAGDLVDGLADVALDILFGTHSITLGQAAQGADKASCRGLVGGKASECHAWSAQSAPD